VIVGRLVSCPFATEIPSARTALSSQTLPDRGRGRAVDVQTYPRIEPRKRHPSEPAEARLDQNHEEDAARWSAISQCVQHIEESLYGPWPIAASGSSFVRFRPMSRLFPDRAHQSRMRVCIQPPIHISTRTMRAHPPTKRPGEFRNASSQGFKTRKECTGPDASAASQLSTGLAAPRPGRHFSSEAGREIERREHRP